MTDTWDSIDQKYRGVSAGAAAGGMVVLAIGIALGTMYMTHKMSAAPEEASATPSTD